jgi:hypothetical protein
MYNILVLFYGYKHENIPNTNDNLSEEKSKKNVSHNKTVIVMLREELS